MKKLRLLKLAGFFTLIGCSQIHAAAFQFYELGAPIVGTAGVGQAAVANDASTAYFNPAGMAGLEASQFMIGSEFILPYSNFSPSSSNTIAGSNGGDASVLVPMLGGYFVYRYSPKWSFGASLTSPYGGALNYQSHWVGRYVVQQMTFYTVNINPSTAYQINDQLSLGVGFVIEYANLNQSVAIPIEPGFDGQANVNVDNFAYGFNLGALYQPTPATRIGLAYRSQIVHHLAGTSSFANIAVTPTTTTKMVMPANIIASLSQRCSDNFTLLGELGWANWSSMRDTILTIDGLSAVTPNNWNDTYRLGIGGRFQAMSNLIVQAGLSFDSSPTSASKRLPDLPVDRQIRLGAGIEYVFPRAVVLALSYEYMNLGNADINNTSSLGTLAGDYSRNYVNVFQASVNVPF